jgi:hypothetical protein
MQELIDKIIARTGISQEQASHVLDTIKTHIGEKFPAIAGTLEGILGNKAAAGNTAGAAASDGGLLQKATHFVEDHAGDIGVKAKDLLSKAEDKIKGMFN